MDWWASPAPPTSPMTAWNKPSWEPIRPAVLAIPRTSLSSPPWPQLHSPSSIDRFNHAKESSPCWTPFGMRKPICWVVTPRSRPSPTTDWLNPCPRASISTVREHCARWSAPKPACISTQGLRKQVVSPAVEVLFVWVLAAANLMFKAASARPLIAPSAIWIIDRSKPGATGFASPPRPFSHCLVPSAACSMRVRCSMGLA